MYLVSGGGEGGRCLTIAMKKNEFSEKRKNVNTIKETLYDFKVFRENS